MDANFHGKRALVTGAGQGIGRAIAKELANLGAQVVAISRTPEHLETLRLEAPLAETVVLDLSDWEKTRMVVSELGVFDFLVNNAGVSMLQPVGEITEDAFDRVFAVNVKAVVNVSQEVAKNMKTSGRGGSIVNISSQGATAALENHTVYCSSKAALDQVTKVMALELGPHRIRVNSVNPTVVLTEMGKMAWGDPTASAAMKAKIPLGKFCAGRPPILLPTWISSRQGPNNTTMFTLDRPSQYESNVSFTVQNSSSRTSEMNLKDPADVVNAVLFLLSEKSAMITGAQLPVDGGYTIC